MAPVHLCGRCYETASVYVETFALKWCVHFDHSSICCLRWVKRASGHLFMYCGAMRLTLKWRLCMHLSVARRCCVTRAVRFSKMAFVYILSVP